MYLATAVSILAVVLLVCGQEAVPLAQTQSQVDSINEQHPGWTAGINKKFANITLEQAKAFLGLAEEPLPEAEQITRVQASPRSILDLPSSFDARNKWPSCTQPIRDQAGCGACWAFAATSAMGIRLCIASNGAVKVPMSPQYLTSCDTGNNGCGGGTLSGGWRFMQSSGSVADTDYPFTSGNGNSGTCNLKAGAKKYYVSTFKTLSSVADMQNEIYNNGPIQVGFAVYSDFYSYRSGVYSYTSGSYSGGHSVYLVGWGELNGVPYWIAVNSWGSSWGMAGTFWIKRGVNMVNIETGYRPVAGTPIIPATDAPTTTTTTRAPTTTTTTRAPTTTTTTAPPTTTTTTRAPTTAAPTTLPSCWTCPAGYVHWFDIKGSSVPANGDLCSCVVDPNPTTKAPTTTTTAAPTTTTTKAPTTTTTTAAPTTTTKAPTTITTTTKAPVAPTTTKTPATTKAPAADSTQAPEVLPTMEPSTDAPASDAPASSEAPSTDEPTSEAPESEAPSNTTATPSVKPTIMPTPTLAPITIAPTRTPISTIPVTGNQNVTQVPLDGHVSNSGVRLIVSPVILLVICTMFL